MAKASWEVNDKAVDEMLRQPGMAAHLRQLSEVGLAFAQSIAPVRTGRYRDSLVVVEPRVNEAGVLESGFGSDSPYWHLVEFGSPWNIPRRVLAQAALAVAPAGSVAT